MVSVPKSLWKCITLVYNFLQKVSYNQTCLYDHLYTTTTRLRRPMLSPPKLVSIQSLMNKAITCLTRPATTFFVPKMKKKNLSKQPLQNFIQRRNGKQCIKNKCLSDYIYSTATLYCKVCLMFVKTGHFHLR